MLLPLYSSAASPTIRFRRPASPSEALTAGWPKTSSNASSNSQTRNSCFCLPVAKIAAMLSLVSKLYGKVADLRNALYERGIFDRHGLKAFTVSIGNITTGGTGKTPLVAYVAEMLAARGEKVCILTRGYGRKNVSERV